MAIPHRFTYPFCYNPIPEVRQEAASLIDRIHSDPYLDEIFREGKMLGVMMTEDGCGATVWLHAFSGLAGGHSTLAGFVPPIFDYSDPEGHFKKVEREISDINLKIRNNGDDSGELSALRKEMSAELQDWLFSRYVVLNASGKGRSIREVFADRGLVPPGGTGECATPKMLQYAYLHKLKPLAMGEFWIGASPLKEVRREGSFYPACTGKCGPLLSYMMQGLELQDNPLDSDERWDYGTPSIVYQDEWLVVADKPSGMLCVPGRTDRESLQEWLSKVLGRDVYSCHRLDMDTSGLVVFALDADCRTKMQKQFAEGEVRKMYLARLVSGPFDKAEGGYIRLPLMLDYYDRPRQMVDWENGKMAVTRYEVQRILPNGEIDVKFFPCTGRTHQLRVHAAHSAGLGHPIKGDRLYGGGEGRLCLRAASLDFKHPVTGDKMHFCVES